MIFNDETKNSDIKIFVKKKDSAIYDLISKKEFLEEIEKYIKIEEEYLKRAVVLKITNPQYSEEICLQNLRILEKELMHAASLKSRQIFKKEDINYFNLPF